MPSGLLDFLAHHSHQGPESRRLLEFWFRHIPPWDRIPVDFNAIDVKADIRASCRVRKNELDIRKFNQVPGASFDRRWAGRGCSLCVRRVS